MPKRCASVEWFFDLNKSDLNLEQKNLMHTTTQIIKYDTYTNTFCLKFCLKTCKNVN